MPAKAKTVEPVYTASAGTSLQDLPFQFLTDKYQWGEFKRAIENCGLTWNIPDWLYTITYKGVDYKELKKTDATIDDVFPEPAISVLEKKMEVADTSKKWLNLIGLPKMSNSQSYSTKFCNLNKMEFEPDSKLPARQKMWTWFVKCLHGGKQTPGPFYYLTNQVQVYDISYLFKRLSQVMDTVTICSLDDEVYNVTHLDFDPSKQDLFGYVEELRIAMQRLEEVNNKLPEDGRVVLSETYLRSRIVRAARQVTAYKTVIDNIITLPLADWSTMKVGQLLQRLESATANDLSLVPRRGVSYQSTAEDIVVANYATGNLKKSQTTNQKSDVCYQFAKSGSCTRLKCPFLHDSALASTSAPEKKVKEVRSKKTNLLTATRKLLTQIV